METISFDISSLKHAQTPRSLEIDKFHLPIPYQLSDSTYSKISRGILNRLSRYAPTFLRNLGYLFTDEIGFEISITQSKFREISGYFQSWRYFEQVHNYLPDCAPRIKDVSPWTSRKIEEVRMKDPIICHVRRGDYLELNDVIGVLSFEYYKNALRKLRDKGIAGPVWIVTDSPQMISDVFLLEMQAEIMDEPKGGTAAEIFSVMQSCNHFIISNSTFSWWAAFTSESSNVVSPKPWFKNLKEPLDLIPNGWLRIDSTWA